jgi:galactose mutarotase-like enzyme
LKQIKIKNENSQAIISSIGGTVVEFTCRGTNIIYPQKTLRKGVEMKERGGIPICFPFFGPPKPTFKRLKQHGWLRDEELAVVSISSDSVVLKGENRYRKTYPWHMRYQVTVSIVKDGLLKTKLWIVRLKDGIASRAPINPAFHPYFANSFGHRTRIVDINDSDSLFSAEIKVHPDGKAQIFHATDDILINLGLRKVRMSLRGDFGKESRLVLWSDGNKYFCVEPVLADPDSFNTPNGRYLEEGEWLTIVCLLKVLM